MLAVADLDARVGERRAGGGGDRRGRCDVAEDEVAPGEVAISNNLTIGPELALRVEVDDARVVEAVTRGLVAMHRRAVRAAAVLRAPARHHRRVRRDAGQGQTVLVRDGATQLLDKAYHEQGQPRAAMVSGRRERELRDHLGRAQGEGLGEAGA